MPLFRNKYISHAVFAAQFRELDERVRLKQAEFETAFSAVFRNQSQQTNVPDNGDPTLPRILLLEGPKQLMLTQRSCQLDLNFEPGRFNFADQVKIVFSNIEEIALLLPKFKKKEDYGTLAVILSVNYASDQSREELVSYLHERFSKIKPEGVPASFAIKSGYLVDGDLFLNLELDVYEMRKGKIENPTGQPMVITPEHLSAFPIQETGINLKVDVNDKPQWLGKSEGRFDYVTVLRTALDAASERADGLLGNE